MKNSLETILPYWLLAVIVLIIFYGIYFTKMLAQKRRGIQTRQIGRRKEKSIHIVEVAMGIATLCVPVVQLISIISGWDYMPANARFTGFLIAMLGNIIFLISILCMKDSWRAGIPEKHKTRLVTRGILQYTRNPGFLGYDLHYIGVLFMYCNPLTVVCSVFAMSMLHLQILQEERYLVQEFGEEYLEYKSRVFRYLGRRVKTK